MKNRIILLVIVLAFVAVIACAFLYYNNGLKAVKEGNGEDIIVKIEEGTGVTGIARLLEENKVIRDQDIMKIYCRLNNVRGLQAGTYKLNNGENLKTILGHISNGEVYKDSVRITFVEGKNMRYYITHAGMVSKAFRLINEDIEKTPERIATNWIPLITKYLDWYKTDYQPLKDLLERNNIPVSTVMQSDPLDSDIIATGKVLDAVENTIPALCDICLLILKETEITWQTK